MGRVAEELVGLGSELFLGPELLLGHHAARTWVLAAEADTPFSSHNHRAVCRERHLLVLAKGLACGGSAITWSSTSQCTTIGA
jgi:hypothetical protein